jgi:hypothetical protein
VTAVNLKFGSNVFEFWLDRYVDVGTIEQVLSTVTPGISYVLTDDRFSVEDQAQTFVRVWTLPRGHFPTRVYIEQLSDSIKVRRPFFEKLAAHFGCSIVADPPDGTPYPYRAYEWVLFDGQDWWLVDDQLGEPPEFRITGPAPPIENESQNKLGSDSP